MALENRDDAFQRLSVESRMLLANLAQRTPLAEALKNRDDLGIGRQTRSDRVVLENKMLSCPVTKDIGRTPVASARR